MFLPLLERGRDDVLFRTPRREVTAATFFATARDLMTSLPATPYVVNLFRDRLAFAEGFAAAVLNGQVSLLTSDRSDRSFRRLTAMYPGVASFSEGAPEIVTIAHHGGERAAPKAGETPPNAEIPADRLAAIVFTSGSTGEPIGHRKLWGALASRSRDAAERFGFRKEQPVSIIATVPPWHMYGFETTILLPFVAPVSVWCGPAFYPADIYAALDACPEPRVLVTTPLQIRTLLAAKAELPRLISVVSAAAPLDAAMAREAEERWETDVQEIFGATEVGSIASRRTTAGAIWTTYPHVQLIASCGPDADYPVVNAPYAEPVRLNDHIEWLDPTHFRLLGRRSDIVKLGGRRASLAALNQVLISISGVEDGVFVVPNHSEHQETARLSAFVVAPGCSTEEIRSALRTRIDPLFLPRRIIKVECLPRNELGKLTKEALVALDLGREGC